MTTITINNKKLDHEINANTTMDNLIELILTNHAGADEIITSIRIDEQDFDFEKFQDQQNEDTVGKFSNINVVVRSGTDLAFEALSSCPGYIDEISKEVKQVLDFYAKNQLSSANQQFAQLIIDIDALVQFISRIGDTIKVGMPDFKKSELNKKVELHLLSILRSLLPAKEQNDIIMLCDLLEYELMDNLETWKNKVIPDLLKLQNN